MPAQEAKRFPLIVCGRKLGTTVDEAYGSFGTDMRANDFVPAPGVGIPAAVTIWISLTRGTIQTMDATTGNFVSADLIATLASIPRAEG